MKKKVIVTFFVILSVILVFVLYRLLTLYKYQCINQYGSCSSEVNQVIEPFVGRPYLSARRSINQALKDNMYVSEYSLRYNFPLSLNIYVIEETPAVAIKEAGGAYSLYNSAGMLLGQVEESFVPTVLLEEYNPREKEREYAVSLLYALHSTYGIWFGRMHNDGIVFEIESKQVIFPLEGDIDVLLGSLTLLLFQLNSDGENFKIESADSGQDVPEIRIFDLRYKNPVLR